MSDYSRAIAHHCEGIRAINPGAAAVCPDCVHAYGIDDTGDVDAMQGELDAAGAGEGSFSWSACDTCGTSLGGDRHEAHGFLPGGALIHLDICTDCLLFFANGDEPETWEAR